ncbi:MAG: hypothetical protein KDJ86_15800 [Bauldia sp.]|uniref:hypothetical protein n=1 Tax=Bauldia sp. TaxID=2575872 RepID=UPI001D465F63|nr:hypothetical protein [Bauldia sp.]MCB1497253.1 hypothetical protein [Bauldia sp.]
MIGDNAPEEAAQQDAAPLAATVLGEAIHTSDPNELQEAILSRLFDRYAAEHGIVVEPAEIDAYVAAVRSGEAAEGGAVEQDETGAADELLRGMADAVIRRWKINKALYERNGGRIIYQQLGPEPLDAYREFLEDSERQGAFKIVEAPMAAGFWRYFRDESMHDFMAPGGPDEAQAFVVPPWERGQ